LIREFPLPAPPLDTQRRIAAVLAAYDELIENNLRRIEILEEMTHAIYREWFVNFCYPGHEADELVDSPLGPIPDGWTVRTVGDVAEYVSRGVSPKYHDGSDALVINQRCIRGHRVSLETARRHATSVRPEKLVRAGDVLVNSTGVGTLGRVAQVRRPMENTTVDSHVTIVRPPDWVGHEYWGRMLVARESWLESLGAGATGQTELRKSALEGVELLIPDPDLVRAYGDLVQPMDGLAENLVLQIENLRTSRDLLLPKLVSGEIDVSDLDINTSWLAA
jgi:type I restriction enzyme S subunit